MLAKLIRLQPLLKVEELRCLALAAIPSPKLASHGPMVHHCGCYEVVDLWEPMVPLLKGEYIWLYGDFTSNQGDSIRERRRLSIVNRGTDSGCLGARSLSPGDVNDPSPQPACEAYADRCSEGDCEM